MSWLVASSNSRPNWSASNHQLTNQTLACVILHLDRHKSKSNGEGKRERERATHGVGNRQRAQGERERERMVSPTERVERERERKEKVFLKWKYNRGGGGGERGRKQKKRVKCRQNLCLLSLSWLCWNIMNSIAVGSQVMSRWLSFPLKIILAKSREGKKHFVAFHFFVFSEDLSGK